MTESTLKWPTLAMALVLASVHLFAGKMRFLEGIPPEPVAVDGG